MISPLLKLRFSCLLLIAMLIAPELSRAEVILEYFNTSWNEITNRMPELAEAGYTAMWLPAPFKATSIFDVGYGTYDRFDIGNKVQKYFNQAVATKYGTGPDLIRLVVTAHRFGIRVYFDNITNQNGGPVPGSSNGTPLDIQPGFVPEDFHLETLPNGLYTEWSTSVDYNNVQQIQLRNPFGIDIAQENPNASFGDAEFDTYPKYTGIRHPNNPELYPNPNKPTTVTITNGFSNTYNVLGTYDGNGVPYAEDDSAMLFRAVRWFIDTVKCDGFRLDNVKGQPDYWFGLETQQGSQSKDASNLGYLGNIEEQYNISHGYTTVNDWNNLRESLFNTQIPRHNAMVFGEDLGSPPAEQPYVDAGMRLIDNGFYGSALYAFGGSFNATDENGYGMDQGGWGSFGGVNTGIVYIGSQDYNFVWPGHYKLAHAMMLTGQSLPIVYTDGFNHSGTVESAFPRVSITPFLGESAGTYLNTYAPAVYANATDGQKAGGNYLLNELYIHNQFARGSQVSKWHDDSLVVYERNDTVNVGDHGTDTNSGISAADATVLLFMMARDGQGGQVAQTSTRTWTTTFPAGALLYNYSIDGGGFYALVNASGVLTGTDGSSAIIVPDNQSLGNFGGGFFAFSWKNPGPAGVDSGNPAVQLLQSGTQVGTMTYFRKDGVNGDPNFNPYGGSPSFPVPPGAGPAVSGSYGYWMTIPRVTGSGSLNILARADGSAENILLKLDGGMDLNSQMALGPLLSASNTELRDNPPGAAADGGATDVFLGYEQMQYVQRICEKFAARDVSRNIIGSLGAETYQATIGSGTVSITNGSGFNTGTETAAYVYHDPAGGIFDSGTGLQFSPAPQSAANAPVTLSVKTAYQFYINKVFLYYTTDGATFPEGSGGIASNATTQVVMLNFVQHGSPDGTQVTDWWQGTLPSLPAGTVLRYKIGALETNSPSVFPSSMPNVAVAQKMETLFQVANFNPSTETFYPHGDKGVQQTGLSQGFHILRARSFLNRSGPNRAAIYNTFNQPFYYDTQLPGGQIVFPAAGSNLPSTQQYGAVVRTDDSVTDVQYRIVDGDATNDDSATGTPNGNNAWVEVSQQTYTPSVSSPYNNEWRFNYVNIPPSTTGAATIQVRLRKLTSSTDNTLSDDAGHFTTLTWTGTPNGPNIKMFVEFPGSDGTFIPTNQQPYNMKVWFSPALLPGNVTNPTNTSDSNTQAFLQNFTVTVSSSESGIAAFTVPESSISIDATGVNGGQYDELKIPLPLNTGHSNTVFLVTVTYAVTGSPTLLASRTYTEQPVPFIENIIVSPPQFAADGVTPYTIVLPAAGSSSPLPAPVQSGSSGIQVLTDTNATAVAINFTQGGVNPANIVANPTPTVTGTGDLWSFAWKNVAAGAYTFTSTVTEGALTSSTTQSNTVVFEPLISGTSASADEDNDGMIDADEISQYSLPGTPVNEDVRRYKFSGKTNNLSPDTDNDGLPDGLEAGIATAPASTGTTATLNGGLTFDADADPPIYNTSDNASAPAGQDYSYYSPWPYNANNPATDQIAGSTTDPTKSDTDGDGVPDGVEDLHYILTTATAGQQVPTLTASGTNSSTWGAIILSRSNPFTWSAPITTATAGQQILVPSHNGRVEIGLLDSTGSNITAIIQHPPTIYNTSIVDRTKLPANAFFLETDPNNDDTDSDGLPDGSEDSNHNGMVDLAFVDRDQTDVNGNFVVLGPVDDSNALGFGRYHDFTWRFTDTTKTPAVTTVYNRINKNLLKAAFPPGVWKINPANGHHIGVIWLETDPQQISTSGDSLPDGWKVSHGLDPWDDGVIGDYNLHTGKLINTTLNGPNGLVPGTNITNQTLYLNPTILTSGTSAPVAGTIAIGANNPVTVGGVTNNHEFTSWTAADLLGLDYYDGDGTNGPANNDVYHFYDGYDASRDMVAFYAHDGGAVANGGDGNFYFRVDFQDLAALAEVSNLDTYVAINFGTQGTTGEYNLPDNVKTGTAMLWQAVVACYKTNTGRVYLWNPNSSTHSTAIGQDLTTFGVTARDQTTANGFLQAYFNSDLDACEFSISRQALIDAGWSGNNAATLTYQVYTVRDGTGTGGAGNIAGRSDITDAFYDNWIASDDSSDQAGIDGNNSVLRQWMGTNARNDLGKRIKVVSLIHANEAIQPGNYIQHLINTGSSSGFYRVLDVHQAYNLPVTMHITPTLASAIQWASVSSTSAAQYVDGPAFNRRIAGMASGTSPLIDLIGSTFSDHIVRYFGTPFNSDNVSLASSYLSSIYGQTPSTKIFWDPERVATDSVLSQISQMGFSYTILDQMRHIYTWFGFQSALDDDAYRINSINGMNVFVINDLYNGYLFQNTDNGMPIGLRQLFNQRLMNDGNEDQVFIFENDWESFGAKANADAYDLNMRWIANHPWIEMVTLDQIVNGKIDTSVPPTGSGTTWGKVNRGTGLSLPMASKAYIDHATNQNYDNWYYGLASSPSGMTSQSLSTNQFSIRSSTNAALVPSVYGLNSGSGIIATAWTGVPLLSNSNLKLLARATIHASVFETAFHTEGNTNLETFSNGSFASPPTDAQSLSTLSTWPQSQSREAAVYSRVDAWAAAATTGTYGLSATAQQADIDLDGENEYMIYNDRLFTLFEALGGRMTGAWIRDVDTGAVIQVAGNFAGYAGSATEEEGNTNMTAAGAGAYRTSGFKDWFAQTGGAGVGTSNYVNNYYTVTTATNGIGWTFKSSDGAITKTITLAPRATHLDAAYALAGGVNTLFVRFGMSPNLSDLLINGQNNMGTLLDGTNSEFSVIDNNNTNYVRTFVKWSGTNQIGTSYNATYNPNAVDVTPTSAFNTVNMRNQAQTQEIEMQGTNGMTFSVGFQTGSSVSISTTNDGIPDWWNKQYGLDPTTQSGINGPNADPAGDGLTNYQKWILGLDPTRADYTMPQAQVSRDAQGHAVVQFPTLLDRLYRIYFATAVNGTWTQLPGDITGTGSVYSWTDDGTLTGSSPASAGQRFYKVDIRRIQQ